MNDITVLGSSNKDENLKLIDYFFNKLQKEKNTNLYKKFKRLEIQSLTQEDINIIITEKDKKKKFNVIEKLIHKLNNDINFYSEIYPTIIISFQDFLSLKNTILFITNDLEKTTDFIHMLKIDKFIFLNIKKDEEFCFEHKETPVFNFDFENSKSLYKLIDTFIEYSK